MVCVEGPKAGKECQEVTKKRLPPKVPFEKYGVFPLQMRGHQSHKKQDLAEPRRRLSIR